MSALRLLAVLAHPDDESLGNGGVLSKYADEGIETFLVTATRGELGWFGDPAENPGPEALGKLRETELARAAEVLGLREAVLLDYHDGELHRADASKLARQVVGHVRRVRPDVILTFDDSGLYGHPDHIAISRAATAASVLARDPSYAPEAGTPHGVSKLYHMVWREETKEAYEAAFGELVMHIDGVERRAMTWPDWSITTWIDTEACWERVWEAIRCHKTQLPGYTKLLELPEAYHRALWGLQTYQRVFTAVPAPGGVEDDLFAGLRDGASGG